MSVSSLFGFGVRERALSKVCAGEKGERVSRKSRRGVFAPQGKVGNFNASKAKWDSGCPGVSKGRRASESRAGGNKTSCLVAIQFRPVGIYLNELK